ncbi:30S ribosomal protein S2 [Candidatus Woesebacteria bacterium]|nr:30S ribosomal protein S2 [Candidatus Woesebacteria bacterium]
MVDTAQLENKAPEFSLEELLEAGSHFGHQVAKWHPRMKQYIYMEKDGVHIFDLEKTAAGLTTAYNIAFDLGKNGKTLVFVGTKRQAREVIETACAPAHIPFITSRWLGGLLTNWDQIRRSLKRMLTIEEGLKTDKFKGYTKFERNQLEKELIRLKRFFEGIRGLTQKPDALFLVDINREKIAVREASNVGTTTMALVDSNSNPDLVDVVIPANDDGKRSIEYVVNAIVAGYTAGKNSK